MTAIFKRELKSYFESMTGYIFIAFMILFMGIYFLAYNLNAGYPYFSYALSGMLLIMAIGIPVLTMRCFADERRTKTDQLLLTAPVTVTEIVIGKYLAMATVFLIPVLVYCVCPLIIKANGTAYLAADYSAILAFFLLGCLFIAIGMFLSSLTESQIIAAVGTFFLLLCLMLWGGLLSFFPTTAKGSLIGFFVILLFICFVLYRMTESYKVVAGVGIIGTAVLGGLYFWKEELFDRALVTVLEKFDVVGLFDQFAQSHMFDVSGLILYLSAIFLFLFLTVQSIEKRRWS